MNIIKDIPDDVKMHICLFIPVKYCMNCYKKIHSYNKYDYCSTICRLNYYIFKYFFKNIVKKERAIATNTSSSGVASGKTKFQAITPISQII